MLDADRVISIGYGLLWILVTELAGGPSRSLLIGEAVSVWAFGASWFMKGFELDALRDTERLPRAVAQGG